MSSCRHYSLQHLLDPLTITWERLDYRLSWHLWSVLQALHYSHLSSTRQGLLHSSYAAQLESADLWHLAIFVLLHIPDHWYVQLLLLLLLKEESGEQIFTVMTVFALEISFIFTVIKPPEKVFQQQVAAARH